MKLKMIIAVLAMLVSASVVLAADEIGRIRTTGSTVIVYNTSGREIWRGSAGTNAEVVSQGENCFVTVSDRHTHIFRRTNTGGNSFTGTSLTNDEANIRSWVRQCN